MLKLYKLDSPMKQYWESWDNHDGTHSVHWGELGTQGQRKIVRRFFFRSPESTIRKEFDRMISLGFKAHDEKKTLFIEFPFSSVRSSEEFEKQFRLENRLNDTLGWTGLGSCSGGRLRHGIMRVGNFVVDIDIAKAIIEDDLRDTEFHNYSRIYAEGSLQITHSNFIRTPAEFG